MLVDGNLTINFNVNHKPFLQSIILCPKIFPKKKHVDLKKWFWLAINLPKKLLINKLLFSTFQVPKHVLQRFFVRLVFWKYSILKKKTFDLLWNVWFFWFQNPCLFFYRWNYEIQSLHFIILIFWPFFFLKLNWNWFGKKFNRR